MPPMKGSHRLESKSSKGSRVIRVSGPVFEKLKKLAISKDMAFASPDNVLRLALKMPVLGRKTGFQTDRPKILLKLSKGRSLSSSDSKYLLVTSKK